jgi:xylose isomerase
MKRTLSKLDMAFEYFEKIGAPFYCFHDVASLVTVSLRDEKRLEKVGVPIIKAMQKETGMKLCGERQTTSGIPVT